MSSDNPAAPEPTVDAEPDRAPGGPDADVSESDVGAASEEAPVTPDGPLSAQRDDADIPDAIQEAEEPDVQPEADEGPSEPTG